MATLSFSLFSLFSSTSRFSFPLHLPTLCLGGSPNFGILWWIGFLYFSLMPPSFFSPFFSLFPFPLPLSPSSLSPSPLHASPFSPLSSSSSFLPSDGGGLSHALTEGSWHKEVIIGLSVWHSCYSKMYFGVGCSTFRFYRWWLYLRHCRSSGACGSWFMLFSFMHG